MPLSGIGSLAPMYEYLGSHENFVGHGPLVHSRSAMNNLPMPLRTQRPKRQGVIGKLIDVQSLTRSGDTFQGGHVTAIVDGARRSQPTGAINPKDGKLSGFGLPATYHLQIVSENPQCL